ncbi:MAG: nicotinamide riboside transporter PnuC [Bacteroidota bacterium]
MIEQLLQDISALGLIDWATTLTALVYVILSARNNPWCWPFGIVSCALWAYASYVQYDLYLDALLQVFYVVMGFVGLYQWLQGGEDGGVLPITQMKPREHLWVIGVGLLSGLLFGYAFSYTSATATYWDALTTSFSILATILLVRRQLENWLYWIAIDIVYSGLYFSRGAILFALLMLLYVVIASFAYRSWSKAVEPS